ncbi:MAG: hypothetical protein AAF682_15145 [Planctomycetota bacterium]
MNGLRALLLPLALTALPSLSFAGDLLLYEDWWLGPASEMDGGIVQGGGDLAYNDVSGVPLDPGTDFYIADYGGAHKGTLHRHSFLSHSVAITEEPALAFGGVGAYVEVREPTKVRLDWAFQGHVSFGEDVSITRVVSYTGAEEPVFPLPGDVLGTNGTAVETLYPGNIYRIELHTSVQNLTPGVAEESLAMLTVLL